MSNSIVFIICYNLCTIYNIRFKMNQEKRSAECFKRGDSSPHLKKWGHSRPFSVKANKFFRTNVRNYFVLSSTFFDDLAADFVPLSSSIFNSSCSSSCLSSIPYAALTFFVTSSMISGCSFMYFFAFSRP